MTRERKILSIKTLSEEKLIEIHLLRELEKAKARKRDLQDSES
jgi:hypothetical protein